MYFLSRVPRKFNSRRRHGSDGTRPFPVRRTVKTSFRSPGGKVANCSNRINKYVHDKRKDTVCRSESTQYSIRDIALSKSNGTVLRTMFTSSLVLTSIVKIRCHVVFVILKSDHDKGFKVINTSLMFYTLHRGMYVILLSTVW